MDLFRKVFTAALVMMVAISAQASMKMERQSIPQLNLSIEIPQTLTPMSDEMAKIKYPSENRPQVIYGDERGKASLGISAGRHALPASQIDMAKDATVKMLTNFKPQAEAVTVDGHKAWLITFRSQAPDTDIINLLLITTQNDKAVQVAFNMTQDLVEQYQSAAKASLLSLKFDK